MKVLLSAYSCEPGKGSEPEIGLRTLLAAASAHQVWVLTTESGLSGLREAIAASGHEGDVHLEVVPLGAREAGREVGLEILTFHRRYDRWQRRAGRRARELDRRIGFDLVHHVTLSAYWTRCGVADLDKPLVWGPVGGAVNAPLALLGELGARGIAGDAVRVVGRRVIAALPPARRAARRADLVLAQNQVVAARVPATGPVRVLPNATAVTVDGVPVRGERTKEVVIAGRLVPWKGVPLAIRAWRHVSHPDAVLTIFGEGPDLRRIEATIRRQEVGDSVRVVPWVPRERLLERLATAGAVLHPSLHDEAGLAVAEALSLGTPVVCLDHGGPGEVVRHWPDHLSAAVRPGRPGWTAQRLGEAVNRFLEDPTPVRASPLQPRQLYTDAILAAYEAAVERHRRAG